MKTHPIVLIFLLVLPIFAGSQTIEDIDEINAEAWFLHEKEATRAQALRLADSALKASEKIKYLRGMGNAYSTLAHASLLEGDSFISRKWYDKCLFVRRNDGDSCGVAAVFINFSVLCQQSGNYPEALHYAHRAEQVLETQHAREQDSDRNLRLKRDAYNELSNLLSDHNNYIEGLKYALKALEVAKARNDIGQITESIYTLGNRYYSMQQVKSLITDKGKVYEDSARLMYKAAIQLFKRLEDPDFVKIAECYNNLANIEMEQTDSTGALTQTQIDLIIDYLSKAAALAIPDTSKMFYIWKNLGRFEGQKHNYAVSLSYFKRAEKLRKKEDLSASIDLYDQMSKCLSALGQNNKALFYLRQVDSLKQKIFLEKQDAFNEVEKKALELQKAITAKDLKAEQNKNQMLMLAILAGLLLLLFLWQAYRNMVRKHKEQTLEIKNLLQSADSAYIQAVEQRKQKIASDLHAEIGIHANALDMIAASLHSNLDSDPEAQKESAALRSRIKASFEELRDTVHGLGKTVLEKSGLKAAIDDLIRKILQEKGITIEFVPEGMQPKINNEAAQNLYRIIQNLLGNSLRHAHPQKIRIGIKGTNEAIHFAYTDDGKGFTPDDVNKGIGLNDIQRLANALRSENWNLKTAPNQGFSLTFSVPLNN